MRTTAAIALVLVIVTAKCTISEAGKRCQRSKKLTEQMIENKLLLIITIIISLIVIFNYNKSVM